jgi:hypothetical protein
MHIGHHLAASRFSSLHPCLGVSATVLAAMAGASAFGSLTKLAEQNGLVALEVVASVGIISPAVTAAVSFLKLDERAGRHTKAAASFQALRRDFGSIKAQWREVLKESPPLPQTIHEQAQERVRRSGVFSLKDN